MTKTVTKKTYDLGERTALFGEHIIEFCKQIKLTVITRPLVHQLVKAGTSIGANYMEADVAESKRDFEHKLGICRKEAKETILWLRLLQKAVSECGDTCTVLSREAEELVRIFSAIIHNSRRNRLI